MKEFMRSLISNAHVLLTCENYVFGRNNIEKTLRVPPSKHINRFHLCARCRYCSASLLASFMLRAKAREKKLPAIYVEIIGRHDSKASKKMRRETHQILIFRFSSTHAVTFSWVIMRILMELNCIHISGGSAMFKGSYEELENW